MTVLVLTAGLHAQTVSEWDPPRFSGYFSVLLEPAGPLEPDVYDEEKAVSQLLEEAQFVFSAMIYGFEFSYIPKDSLRGIEEEFFFEPVYSLPWGDPRMSVRTGRYENGIYTAEIKYAPTDEQLPWIRSWETNILPDVTAVGEGSLYEGFDGKKAAVGASVKEAVRAHLRARIYDKPRKISGRARLADVPYFTIDAGRYLCKAKVTLQIDEILEYRSY